MPRKPPAPSPPELRCERCGAPWLECWDRHVRNDNRVVVALLVGVVAVVSIPVVAAFNGWF